MKRPNQGGKIRLQQKFQISDKEIEENTRRQRPHPMIIG